MLKQRIITAVLLAPVLLGIVIYGNAMWMAILVAVIQLAATWEWLKINQLKSPLAFINGVMLTVLTLWLYHQSWLAIDLLIWGYAPIWLLAVIWLIRFQWGRENTTAQVLIKGLLGVVAIMIFAFSLLSLHAREAGQWWTLSLFILIWVADIGAYLSGKTMGKHKLAINISPGKTWEGLVGGLITSGIVAVVGSWLLAKNGIAAPTLVASAFMGVLMGGFGQMGDLAASLLKRDAGVKDSGSSLPGFGGAMDLIDSPILVAPLAYWGLELSHNLGLWATGGA